MSYETYLEYFLDRNGTLPRHWRQRSRRTGVTLNLLALPLFPDDPYGREFRLPHLVRQVDWTLKYRDMSWNDWKAPMLLCLMLSKRNSYDVSPVQMNSVARSFPLNMTLGLAR